MTPTLTPAYGRDYKSKAAVLADFDAGKDFVLSCVGDRWSGLPCNKADLANSGYSTVKFRYAKNTKLFLHSL